MKTSRWVRWDRWMRALHLYTGLFLVPWMTVYAMSAFCLNHKEWFTEGLQLAQTWENVREVEFTPGPGFPQTPAEQAAAILRHLDLEGPHTIYGTPDANQLVMIRMCATGHYRVSWFPPRSCVVVDRFQPTSFYAVINALHFQSGYRPYFAHAAWAVIVDATTMSTILWVISGIYLWARRPRKRLLGGLCLIAGTVLFAILAVLLCHWTTFHLPILRLSATSTTGRRNRLVRCSRVSDSVRKTPQPRTIGRQGPWTLHERSES